MSKMGSHHPFGHLKHKLWPKERSGVKLTIWLPTTKSRESTRFPCVQVACDIPLENSQQRLQLCFQPHLHWRFARKVMVPQSCRSPNLGNFETPRTKSHLDVGPVERRKIYYKGEGGGFPQIQAVVSPMCPSCPCDVLPSPKLGPRWALVSKTMELWGLEGTLQALSTKRGRGACWSSRMGLGRGQALITHSQLHQTNQQVG
jgi:hypothetical protein